MGQPDGGWFDDQPPRIVSTTPGERAVNVSQRKINIVFDEYIKIDDATNKVIVSPPQLEMPEIKTSGKRIIVELKDTLKPNVTYTVDFSDAISDNNEGNPMGNYTYTFSTGERIDTFEVAGRVLDARNLEPIKGILVGLYDDLSDTAFTTKPLQRVARTDGSGRFVVKGVADGQYRVYALQDMDANYQFSQKSEMLAFTHQLFKPTAAPDVRQDTIWRDSLHIDNIVQVPYTHYRPDDIVLLAFQEVQTDRYLLKTERPEPNRISVYFSYGHDELPRLRGLNFDATDAFIVEPTLRRDTINYWLRDTLLVNQDTLRFEMQYYTTDSTGVLVSQTDTIETLAKVSYEKRLKDRRKQFEEWQKEQEKRRKRDLPYDSIMPPEALKPKYNVASALDPDRVVSIEMPTPLERLDTAGLHLYSLIDSLWYRSPFELRPSQRVARSYDFIAEWRPGVEYSLEIDSAAFVDIYGLASKPFKQGIKVKGLDEYATLLVNVSGLPADSGTVIVELLSSSDAPVKSSPVVGGTAEFYYVTPGTYYMRAFVDRNGNGEWDTGLYAADRQPEPVYYLPRSIECKAKWDLTEDWNLTHLPFDRQKPAAITKQKGDQKQKLRNRNADRAQRLGIKYEER